jgi:hypothetical protein
MDGEEGPGEEEPAGELEDRVMDLEDELDELKAEFERIMGGEEAVGDELAADDDEFDAGEEFGADEGEEEMEGYGMGMMEDKTSKSAKRMTEAEWIREYVEKIGEYPGDQKSPTGKMAGAGTGDNENQGERNTKSIVAGKNDMGGKVVGGSPDETSPDGKQIEQPNNEYTKGKGNLPGAGSFRNVPGSNAGKASYKTKETVKTGEVAGTDKRSPVAK